MTRASARNQGRAAVVAAAGVVTLAAACASGARRSADAGADAPATASASSTVRTNQADTLNARTRPVGRVEELFAGRFPGVQVYAAEGGMVVRVRGAQTLRGNNDPLYVVDGVPTAAGTGGLIGINPSDVARIEVVKDAADLAEYGSRSANGVVKITTKRARR